MSRIWENLTYPESPGYKENTTSRDAAFAIHRKASNLQQEVLDYLAIKSATPDEIAEGIGRSILAIRPRVSELVRMGKVEATGQRRKNASGLFAKEYRKI